MNHFKVIDSKEKSLLPYGCKAFGVGITPAIVDDFLSTWRFWRNDIHLILVLAGSKTAEVEGISAAGATAESRRFTALADAELLLKGAQHPKEWPLPPLPAGVSPALISHVCSRLLGLNPVVVAAGLLQPPSFPFLAVEEPFQGPANCLSTGKAMEVSRVDRLWSQGLEIGMKLTKPLLISECVPGGTTTALAVLNGLGIAAGDWISGSLRNPPIELKKRLVGDGLRKASLGPGSSPKALIAAIGDPFQPFATGLLIGARRAGMPVLLGGGSQMIAVLALALSSIDVSSRFGFARDIAIATTYWLADEKTSTAQFQNSLFRLMNLIGEFFDLNLLGFSSGLRFDQSSKKSLKDYELGYIKEGVGAGALSLLAQINGISCKTLLKECELELDQLAKINQL